MTVESSNKKVWMDEGQQTKKAGFSLKILPSPF
jgi:hypothetical protein